MLFMTCNSDYMMLYQNKSGVRLATRPLFLRVRTGAAHLGLGLGRFGTTNGGFPGDTPAHSPLISGSI